MSQNILNLSSERMETLKKMYDFMVIHRGLSPEAASSILGNVMQESAFDHSAVSSKNAKGVYQLLGDQYKNYLSYLKNKNWKDGPLSQTSFVINEIMNGKDTYYNTYDLLKQKQANNWLEPTAEGTGMYKNKPDSTYFTEVFLPREKAGTLPPRRTEAVKVITTSKDIPTITKMFMDYWERPHSSEQRLDARVKYANEIYNYFNKKQGGTLNYFDYFK